MPTHIPAQDLEHRQDSIQRFSPFALAQEVQITTSMVHTFFDAILLFNYTLCKKNAVNETKSMFCYTFELGLVFS